MNPLFALCLAGVSTVGSTVATFVLAITSTEVGPWVQVGGTSTAVAALAYVAKLLADGRLVAQPVANMAVEADRRERKLAHLVEESHQRERDLRRMLIGERDGDER